MPRWKGRRNVADEPQHLARRRPGCRRPRRVDRVAARRAPATGCRHILLRLCVLLPVVFGAF